MTPEQRRLRAQIAANARWSRPFAREDQAAAARAAILARYEREADPTGTLPPDKLAPLVKAKAREHSARLNAAKARKKGSALAFGHSLIGPGGRKATPDGRTSCGIVTRGPICCLRQATQHLSLSGFE